MGRVVYLLPLSEEGRTRLNNVRAHLQRIGSKWTEISTDDIMCNRNVR